MRRVISIHAPLTGCDRCCPNAPSIGQISIHAPLTGCDNMENIYTLEGWLFQSTHPSRGATSTASAHHSPPLISIHAPLTGCDAIRSLLYGVQSDFNPRTPHGVRPAPFLAVNVQTPISIHAPLTGCDCCQLANRTEIFIISIHAPLTGCDPVVQTAAWQDFQFQSTHPSRGATKFKRSSCCTNTISIHAPLTGCDGVGPGGKSGW